MHWQRRGTHVEVVQLKGAAVWNVSPKDTLVIETGSPGATVASVEATGASLRTEVQMLNRTDARVIGIGSAVAALVSITTVVVYEGHVKATSSGQVVNIQAGSTAQFPPSAPVNQPTVQLGVGAGPIAPVPCDPRILLVEAGAMHRDGKHVDALSTLLQSYACKADVDTAYRVAIEACHAHDLKHVLPYWQLSADSDRPQINDACMKEGIDIVSLLAADKDTVGTKDCDASVLEQKGEDFMNNGMDTAALSQFESSLACKDDTSVRKMAYIASCRLKNTAKAQQYFASLGSQGSLVQICMRFGIDPSTPSPSDNTKSSKRGATCDEVSCVLNNYGGACCEKWKKRADVRTKNDREIEKAANENRLPKVEPLPVSAQPCDADGLEQKGENFMNEGKDTQALAMFESSLKCKADSQTMKMAYISSCRLKNATKAKAYFKKLGAQGSLVQVCLRFGIDPAQ